MFRKNIILVLVVLFVMGLSTSFANVSPEDIIVAEPVRPRIANDRNHFITVNITNPDVIQNPIGVSLVRVENKIPFVDTVTEGLSVSVMFLTQNSSRVEGVSPARRVYDIKAKGYSDGFASELKTINRFFEAKDEFAKLETEIAKTIAVNDFIQYVSPQDARSKLDDEAFARYEKWTELRGRRRVLAAELSVLQTEYLTLFESIIFNEEISRLSYVNEVGRLANGHYRLRFIDGNQKLIKEVRFEVVDRDHIVVPLMPFK